MVPILSAVPSTDNPVLAHLANSDKKPPESGVPLVDTVGFLGPIDGFFIPQHKIDRRVNTDGEFNDEVVYAQALLPSGGLVRVHTTRSRDGLTASVERSLPTLAHGHNVHPVSVQAALELIEDLFREASEVVEWGVDVQDLQITRLDLDRDFKGVTHPEDLLRHLAQLPVARVGNASVYYDNHRGGAATLVRKPKKSHSWRASLYDKGTEMTARAMQERDPVRAARLREGAAEAHDHLRFELELRRQGLRDQGIDSVADLDETHLLNLREHYFRRVRFDTPVGGPSRLAEEAQRLLEQGDPDVKFFGQVWMTLFFESQGLPLSCSPTTLARNRKLASDWGLSAADVVPLEGSPVVLDYAAGTLAHLEEAS